MAPALRILLGILITLLSFGFLLPTGIAVARNHPATGSIALWNTVGMLLFGLGWIVALVKALTDGAREGKTITNTVIVTNVIHAAAPAVAASPAIAPVGSPDSPL